MRTIDWAVECPTERFSITGSFEVEDDTSDDEIQQMVDEEACNHVSWGWSERDAPHLPSQSASPKSQGE